MTIPVPGSRPARRRFSRLRRVSASPTRRVKSGNPGQVRGRMGVLLTVVAWVVAALLVAWLGGPLLRWACRTRAEFQP
ncbi:hypothetical protein Nm8I071_56360 [Nonomuraea sp. TT08I-71]|nr:hypothetical protein Nm8I071_56360 [Nonomuraea sp. TT08I-71]